MHKRVRYACRRWPPAPALARAGGEVKILVHRSAYNARICRDRSWPAVPTKPISHLATLSREVICSEVSDSGRRREAAPHLGHRHLWIEARIIPT
jgi:hypothetical protein